MKNIKFHKRRRNTSSRLLFLKSLIGTQRGRMSEHESMFTDEEIVYCASPVLKSESSKIIGLKSNTVKEK